MVAGVRVKPPWPTSVPGEPTAAQSEPGRGRPRCLGGGERGSGRHWSLRVRSPAGWPWPELRGGQGRVGHARGRTIGDGTRAQQGSLQYLESVATGPKGDR